jgi:glucose-6-phosphate-specific signal transduction histidine kinase
MLHTGVGINVMRERPSELGGSYTIETMTTEGGKGWKNLCPFHPR